MMLAPNHPQKWCGCKACLPFPVGCQEHSQPPREAEPRSSSRTFDSFQKHPTKWPGSLLSELKSRSLEAGLGHSQGAWLQHRASEPSAHSRCGRWEASEGLHNTGKGTLQPYSRARRKGTAPVILAEGARWEERSLLCAHTGLSPAPMPGAFHSRAGHCALRFTILTAGRMTLD